MIIHRRRFVTALASAVRGADPDTGIEVGALLGDGGAMPAIWSEALFPETEADEGEANEHVEKVEGDEGAEENGGVIRQGDGESGDGDANDGGDRLGSEELEGELFFWIVLVVFLA